MQDQSQPVFASRWNINPPTAGRDIKTTRTIMKLKLITSNVLLAAGAAYAADAPFSSLTALSGLGGR
jgi:hypothetical protein